jgi:sugar phosphate isomerase/epimerase
MDLGLSLGAFFDFTLDEALDAYRRLADLHRLTAVELNLQIRPGPNVESPWEIPEKRLWEFAAPFKYRGAHLPFIDLNLIATNEGIRAESMKQLRQAIGAAGRMDMTYVVAHASGFRPGLPWDQERSLWLDVFRRLREMTAVDDMTLCIENGACLVRLDRLIEIVETLNDDGIRLCVDIGHAYQRLWDPQSIASRILPRLDERWDGSFRIEKHMPFEAYGSLANFVSQAMPWIHHFHLHDRKGKTDHISLGTGAIDLVSLAPFFAKKPVILEIPQTSEEDLGREVELARVLIDSAGGSR